MGGGRLRLAGVDSHAPGRPYDWQSTVMQAAEFFTTGIPWSQQAVAGICRSLHRLLKRLANQ
eukprot:scaffold15704_cov92-Cyclotella_meneghiniana.AAC.5